MFDVHSVGYVPQRWGRHAGRQQNVDRMVNAIHLGTDFSADAGGIRCLRTLGILNGTCNRVVVSQP
jgi:hypothetical protein